MATIKAYMAHFKPICKFTSFFNRHTSESFTGRQALSGLSCPIQMWIDCITSQAGPIFICYLSSVSSGSWSLFAFARLHLALEAFLNFRTSSGCGQVDLTCCHVGKLCLSPLKEHEKHVSLNSGIVRRIYRCPILLTGCS